MPASVWTEYLNNLPTRVPLGGGMEAEVLQWAYAAHLPSNVPHRHTFFEVCQVGAHGEGRFPRGRRNARASSRHRFLRATRSRASDRQRRFAADGVVLGRLSMAGCRCWPGRRNRDSNRIFRAGRRHSCGSRSGGTCRRFVANAAPAGRDCRATIAGRQGANHRRDGRAFAGDRAGGKRIPTGADAVRRVSPSAEGAGSRSAPVYRR